VVFFNIKSTSGAISAAFWSDVLIAAISASSCDAKILRKGSPPTSKTSVAFKGSYLFFMNKVNTFLL
jgi:hypothetical protein